MTYETENHDPSTEALLCSDEELAQAGFSVCYPHEMPERDAESVTEDGNPLDSQTDAFLAEAAYLESHEGFARGLALLNPELERAGEMPPCAEHRIAAVRS